MNIILLSWRGPGHPLQGGAEIAGHEISKRLVLMGHSVTRITSWYKGCTKNEVIDGVKILRFGDPIVGVRIYAFVYLLINLSNVDIVIDEFHGIPFFTPLYMKNKSIGYIHEVAKKVWDKNHLQGYLKTIIGYLGEKIEPLIFKIVYKNTNFITVSNSTKKDLLFWGIKNEKITVIPNGVTPQPMGVGELTKNLEKPNFVYCGALSEDKGIHTAIHAFEQILRYHPNSNLFVLGKSTKYFENLISSGGIGQKILNKIKIMGYVSEEKKYELMSKSLFLINPSEYEGWGLVNIEANLVGTPVVGFVVPGMVDSVKNGVNGVLVERNKGAAEIAKVIVDLMRKKSEYLRLTKGSVKWAKRFSWDKSAKKFEKCIKNLV